MSKKRSIISYEKLTIDQKKQLLIAFPDGFSGNTSKMTNPITGEVYDSLLWETDEVIYLVKLPKAKFKVPSADDDEDDFEEEEFDAKEDDDESSDDEEEDNYGDKPEEAADDEKDDKEEED